MTNSIHVSLLNNWIYFVTNRISFPHRQQSSPTEVEHNQSLPMLIPSPNWLPPPAPPPLLPCTTRQKNTLFLHNEAVKLLEAKMSQQSPPVSLFACWPVEQLLACWPVGRSRLLTEPQSTNCDCYRLREFIYTTQHVSIYFCMRKMFKIFLPTSNRRYCYGCSG